MLCVNRPLIDQEWTADYIKIDLKEKQCHTLPVFVFCVYFTFQTVKGFFILRTRSGR
jgi:hypothetical protein